MVSYRSYITDAMMEEKKMDRKGWIDAFNFAFVHDVGMTLTEGECKEVARLLQGDDHEHK